VTDFSNHPPSIGEIKSARGNDGSLWTPREVLVKMLREIDDGKVAPDVLVIAWSDIEAGKRRGHFSQSTPDPLLSMGLMQAMLFKMQE
jgi:hypothetical protein